MTTIHRFSVIAFVENDYGMAQNGSPPIRPRHWMDYFRTRTCGNVTVPSTSGRSRNAVIMGRVTFEAYVKSGAMNTDAECLPNRDTYVISRTLHQDDFMKVTIYKSLLACLVGIVDSARTFSRYDEVFIMGGQRLFAEALSDFLPYCNTIYLGRSKNSSTSDTFFPRLDRILPPEILCPPTTTTTQYPSDNPRSKNGSVEFVTADYTLHIYHLAGHFIHPEQQYLSLLKTLVDEQRVTRLPFDGAGVILKRVNVLQNHEGVIQIDLSNDRLPAITTRKIHIDDILAYLCIIFQRMLDANARTRQTHLLSSNMTKTLEMILNEWPDEALSTLTAERRLTLNLNGVHSPVCLHMDNSDKSTLNLYVSFVECEVIVDLPEAMIVFAALAKSIAQINRIKAKMLTISIYTCVMDERHMSIARSQLEFDPKPWPHITMHGMSSVRDLHNIELNNFKIQGYDYWKEYAALTRKPTLEISN